MATATRTNTKAGSGQAIAIARVLADEFRARAAGYDRTGEFPTANYDRMREEGYLRALVPTELGGLGAGYLEMAQAQPPSRGVTATAIASPAVSTSVRRLPE